MVAVNGVASAFKAKTPASRSSIVAAIPTANLRILSPLLFELEELKSSDKREAQLRRSAKDLVEPICPEVTLDELIDDEDPQRALP